MYDIYMYRRDLAEFLLPHRQSFSLQLFKNFLESSELRGNQKGKKKKTLNELKCYEGKHSINVQIQQIPLQCYIIIYHIVLYNEQILFKITQIGQIKVNKSFFSSEQKLECKNLKCVDFWMEFGWFFFGHKLDLIATFLIFMQHNTTESQSNMQSMLKRIKSE